MMAAAVDLAESIAQMSPVAIQGTKINMNYSRDHSVEEGLEYMVRKFFHNEINIYFLKRYKSEIG